MSKKKLSIQNLISFPLRCFLIVLSIFTLGAYSVNAQCGSALGIYCNPVDSKVSNLIGAVTVVSLYLLSLAGIIALVFVVIAGIKYIVSSGNEEKMKSAKDAFSSAAMGLAIILLAYSILSVIYGILNS